MGESYYLCYVTMLNSTIKIPYGFFFWNLAYEDKIGWI